MKKQLVFFFCLIIAYKGAIAENMVAAAFVSNNIKLYYYHAPSGSPELDFLLEKNGEINIVECKSTNNRATSMKYVIKNQKKYGVHPAIKFADTNVGKGEGFITLPLYAIGFIEGDRKSQIIDVVDVSKLTVPKA